MESSTVGLLFSGLDSRETCSISCRTWRMPCSPRRPALSLTTAEFTLVWPSRDSFKCNPLCNSCLLKPLPFTLGSGTKKGDGEGGQRISQVRGSHRDLTPSTVFPAASPGLHFYIHVSSWASENQGKAGRKDLRRFCSSPLSSLSSCLPAPRDPPLFWSQYLKLKSCQRELLNHTYWRCQILKVKKILKHSVSLWKAHSRCFCFGSGHVSIVKCIWTHVYQCASRHTHTSPSSNYSWVTALWQHRLLARPWDKDSRALHWCSDTVCTRNAI